MESIIFNNQTENRNLKTLLLLPSQSGLFGFAVFFTIIIFSKLISYLIGVMPSVIIELPDIYLSLIGFVLLFLISLLKNISSSTNHKQLDQREVNKKVERIFDESKRIKKTLSKSA